jgi:hypothetical protein
MQFTFKIKETWAQLIANLKNNQSYEYSDYKNEKGKFSLTDTDFHVSAVGEYTYTGFKITTMWSKFVYEFKRKGGAVFCTYNGAYKGFLTQNLLPEFTPVLTGQERVTATGFKGILADYLAIKRCQAKVSRFQNTISNGLRTAEELLRGGQKTAPWRDKFPLEVEHEELWEVGVGYYTDGRGVRWSATLSVNGRPAFDGGEPTAKVTDQAIDPVLKPERVTIDTGIAYPVRDFTK